MQGEDFDRLKWEDCNESVLIGFSAENVELLDAGYNTESGEKVYCGILLHGTDANGVRKAVAIEAGDEYWNEREGLFIQQALITDGEAAV